MLSRTGEYALRAVLLMAVRNGGRALPAGEIAAELGVPRNYLSKTLQRLAKRGVLVSIRGPGGGFRLGKPAEELAIAEVVAEFDEVGPMEQCLMGERACDPSTPCAVHERWERWSGEMSRLLEATTVADFLVDNGRSADGGGVREVGGADE